MAETTEPTTHESTFIGTADVMGKYAANLSQRKEAAKQEAQKAEVVAPVVETPIEVKAETPKEPTSNGQTEDPAKEVAAPAPAEPPVETDWRKELGFDDSAEIKIGDDKKEIVKDFREEYEQATKELEDFNNDTSNIIICNIKAGGVGISLHDLHGNHPRISIISPSWSAQDVIQSLGRVHRAKGKTAVRQRIVYCKNTVEEQICENIKEKIKNIFINGNFRMISYLSLMKFIDVKTTLQ